MDDIISPHFEDESFIGTLEHLGIAAALDEYIDPQLVRRWGYLEVERFLGEHGYRFVREHGNIYGKLKIERVVPTAPAPILRVVTRSDVAAVFGKRRAA